VRLTNQFFLTPWAQFSNSSHPELSEAIRGVPSRVYMNKNRFSKSRFWRVHRISSASISLLPASISDQFVELPIWSPNKTCPTPSGTGSFSFCYNDLATTNSKKVPLVQQLLNLQYVGKLLETFGSRPNTAFNLEQLPSRWAQRSRKIRAGKRKIEIRS
jgi:hypothetical protein